MKTIDVIAPILLVVGGGLNWFLVGVLNFDLVEFLSSSIPFIQKLVYIIMALAAFYQIFQWKIIQNRSNA